MQSDAYRDREDESFALACNDLFQGTPEALYTKEVVITWESQKRAG